MCGKEAQRELILNNSGNAEGTGQFSVVVTDADGKTALDLNFMRVLSGRVFVRILKTK